MDIEIKKYDSTYKEIWDNFVVNSKNGTFLFYRDFIEYHSDRFIDFSLLIYLKNKLIAVLPANIKGKTLYSHQGLTYGGLILSTYIKAIHVIEIFQKLNYFLVKIGVSQLIYKSIPHIYHKQPSEEDLYALFLNDAKLVSRSISSCIYLDEKISFSKLRIRMRDKALAKGLTVRENSDFESFWAILRKNLKNKYQTEPTHSLLEIESLKANFPNNIFLYEVYDGTIVLGGCVLFIWRNVAHVQYISSSKQGREVGAIDLLFDQLIISLYNTVDIFEFGTSTESGGKYLNEGLISQKEGFGARGIVYDTYKLELNNI